MYKFGAIACLMSVLVACNTKKDYDSLFKDPNLYCSTVYQLNTVVMGNNFPPIIASRNYLYANVAAYEIIAAGYPAENPSILSSPLCWPSANWANRSPFPSAV